MITTKDFKRQVAKPFGQEMQQHGFKGTGFKYFKETTNYLIAVYIVPSRWGGSCTAGFAIHPKQVDKDYDGKKDLTKLKVHQYEFKMNLSKDARGKRWNFTDDEETNLVTLTKILRTIKETAFPVIERFTETPGILDLFDVAEMDDFHENWTKKTGVSIATTNVRFAWAITLIFEKKNLEKAKPFAEWGLSQLIEDDKDWFGLKDFERVLRKNNGA